MKNSSTHRLIWRLNRSVDYCCNEDSLFLESLFSHLLDIYDFWIDLVEKRSFTPNRFPRITWMASSFTRWGISLYLIEQDTRDGKLWLRFSLVSSRQNEHKLVRSGVPILCRTCALDIQYEQNQLIPILYGLGTPSHICLT